MTFIIEIHAKFEVAISISLGTFLFHICEAFSFSDSDLENCHLNQCLLWFSYSLSKCQERLSNLR